MMIIGKPTRDEIKKKIEKNKGLYVIVTFIFITTCNSFDIYKNIRYEISEEEWLTIELPKPEDVCINLN
jgi:hypothetical protein